MKKIVYYSLCAVALAALSSCQEDIVEEAVIPAQTGDEITFGSELDEQLTKTIYGPLSADKTRYPVEWEDGDHISIYCPEAAQTKIVKYKITPNPSNPSTSSAVTKVNPDEAGLQWGDAPTHHFSAFYPGDRILGSVEGKLRAEIPVRQEPVRWEKEKNTAGGTTYTGVANTDYAFMWAYGKHDKSNGGDVALTFKAGTVKLYLNGELAEEGTSSQDFVDLTLINNLPKKWEDEAQGIYYQYYDFFLGQWNQSRFLNGCMAEARLWSVARSDDQIADNATYLDINDEVGCYGLLGYWKLSGDEETALKDYSPNHMDAEILGENTFVTTDVPVEYSR